jgi:transcriptional regulator with XRE-family HTH domain
VALRDLLQEAGLSQRELAAGIGKSDALVSRLVSGEATPSKETIDKTLYFLSGRLGRPVTYEELFGAPESAADLVHPAEEPA